MKFTLSPGTKKIIVGIVATLVITGMVNAAGLFLNMQSFMTAQVSINTDTKSTNAALVTAVNELKIQTAEMKEQTAGLDRRLQLMENRQK